LTGLRTGHQVPLKNPVNPQNLVNPVEIAGLSIARSLLTRCGEKHFDLFFLQKISCKTRRDEHIEPKEFSLGSA